MNGSHAEQLDAIADAIREHQKRQGIRDLKTHCICGWVSKGANGPGEHIRHQAAKVLGTLTEGRIGAGPYTEQETTNG